MSARDLLANPTPDVREVERIADERLGDLYADAGPLAENITLRLFLRAAYAKGLVDASEQPFPFADLGYRQPPAPAPYAWTVGKTFPMIPQVETAELWGGAFKELHAELEAWVLEVELVALTQAAPQPPKDSAPPSETGGPK